MQISHFIQKSIKKVGKKFEKRQLFFFWHGPKYNMALDLSKAFLNAQVPHRWFVQEGGVTTRCANSPQK